MYFHFKVDSKNENIPQTSTHNLIFSQFNSCVQFVPPKFQ